MIEDFQPHRLYERESERRGASPWEGRIGMVGVLRAVLLGALVWSALIGGYGCISGLVG